MSGSRAILTITKIIGVLFFCSDTAKDVVTVGGDVQRPGPVEFTDGATIYAMILKAGGPTKLGSVKRVVVCRDGKSFHLDLTDEKVKNETLAKPNDTYAVTRRMEPGR